MTWMMIVIILLLVGTMLQICIELVTQIQSHVNIFGLSYIELGVVLLFDHLLYCISWPPCTIQAVLA